MHKESGKIDKQTVYYQAESLARQKLNPVFRATRVEEHLDNLGDRLCKVRKVLTYARSDWARNYWAQVEAHLVRRIHNLQLEA
jgi:hypothetical protein